MIGGLLFAGTIIGAGILGLPFALAQGGFVLGALLLLLGAFFAWLSAAQIGALVYEQGPEKPLTSIIENYMGRRMSYLALGAILFSSYGALIAYPLAIGQIGSTLLHLPAWVGALLFILLMTGLLSRKLNESNQVDAIITLALVVLLLWVLLRSLPQVRLDNFLFSYPSRSLGAFGVVIFAFAGHVVIPNVISYMKAKSSEGIRVLGWSVAAVGLLYLLFFAVAIGVMGTGVTRVATLGLARRASLSLIVAGQVFAVLAIITSFFGLAISLRMTFESQFHLKKPIVLVMILVPVLAGALLLAGNPGGAFVKVLNYAGGIGSAVYIGLILALIIADRRYQFRVPLGRSGAGAAIIFYGLAILYTLFHG
ncbi:MAG: aromatic amino acid transport family protein [Deltaproteobacteria bacterium]